MRREVPLSVAGDYPNSAPYVDAFPSRPRAARRCSGASTPATGVQSKVCRGLGPGDRS